MLRVQLPSVTPCFNLLFIAGFHCKAFCYLYSVQLPINFFDLDLQDKPVSHPSPPLKEYNRGIISTKNKATIVFLSTYPPRECGIATFTQDLLSYCVTFLGNRILCKVAAFNLTPLDTYIYPKEVVWEIDQNNKKEHVRLAKIVNEDKNISGVIVQHEYGIFGGIEGKNILDFMQNCKKPMLVTLHTVLPVPNPKMKDITKQIINHACAVVVLTEKSKEIIEHIFPESKGKIFVIPHGIHPTTYNTPKKYKEKLELENHTILSTFGLIGPGKGIEYVINALPEVIKKYPSILYLILGETHPVIRRRDGEKYRIKLSHLVTKLHIEKHVKFYDQYLSLGDLFEFLKATDIYIATSTNPNQAVSGTLSYALGTGRAVISTEFTQAKELVTTEMGRLVPIKDSQAITNALLELLSNKKRLEEMSRTAYEKTRPMLWSNVAEQYIKLLTQTMIPVFKIDHLRKMTDSFGLFQFALFTNPNKDYGYTLDDNARALILCSWMIQKHQTKELETLIIVYLNFVKKCLQKDGSFINYISFKDKHPSMQNTEEDLEDASSRALWALSEIMINKTLSLKIREEAEKIFLLAYKKGLEFTHLRAKAFAIKSFSLAISVLPDHRQELIYTIKKYADALVDSLKKNSHKSWVWFEGRLQYSNGLLPESLLIAGKITKNSEYFEKGILTLDFLIRKTFSSNMYRPIGHSHWYKNNQKRSDYDQQPEDPASMILALKRAYSHTHDDKYMNLAKKCFSWFLGNNTLQISLYDEKSGGSFDGLHPDRVNLNEGAESLVSFLMSSFVINELL